MKEVAVLLPASPFGFFRVQRPRPALLQGGKTTGVE